MNKHALDNTWIYIYKLIFYTMLYAIFMSVLSQVNYALLRLTRTSVITTLVFILSLIFMRSVYGGLLIGKEKSKPIILSTTLSMFFVNIISVVVLYVMGINEFGYKKILLKYFYYILIVFFLQVVYIYIAIHLGNFLYFKLNSAEKVVVIHDGNDKYRQVCQYIKSYDKQYNLLEIYKINEISIENLKNIDRVFLVTEVASKESIIRNCMFHNISITYMASISDVGVISDNYTVIDDILMIELDAYQYNFFDSFLKRLIDLFVSLLALIITSPILLVVALAIKLEDGGSIFFLQERYTKDKKIFKIIKFRSMIENAGNAPAKDNDDRITGVGELIRKYRIDELPQFINVLKGDMSVVGPRPESLSRFHTIIKDLPEFDQRLRVKGGLTGYAQILGKYNTSPEQKLIFDLKYIYNYNVFEDIKLIFQTFIVFFKKDSTAGFN